MMWESWMVVIPKGVGEIVVNEVLFVIYEGVNDGH